MATANITVGVVVLTAIGSAIVGALLPNVKPITVHSLKYQDGVVHQERTITAGGEVFYATWRADVINEPTGIPVCSGQGSWKYPVGYKVAEIPLAEWVGDEECTPENLRQGDYRLRAVWFWGGDQTNETSELFTIEADQ